MRILFLTSLVGVLAAGAAASAQPESAQPWARSGVNDSAILCLDGLGINHIPVCHSIQASRFPTAPDICQCHGPYRQVRSVWCAPGQRPPPDTIEFNRALIDFAKRNHNDVRDFRFNGTPMCVPLSPAP
jgi:hypothetical protein